MTMISITKTMCENPVSIYTRKHILIRKSRTSFFNVFCSIERVLVNDINKVRLNKEVNVYLVGISFLEQKLFSFYLLLKSWHFPDTRFGQNSDDILKHL